MAFTEPRQKGFSVIIYITIRSAVRGDANAKKSAKLRISEAIYRYKKRMDDPTSQQSLERLISHGREFKLLNYEDS
jgi:hypothetical protein